MVVSSFIADRAEYWWDVSRQDAPSLWDSTIRLGEEFFNEIIRHPIPLDLNTIKALKAVAARVGFVLLARVSHVHAQGSINPLVEAALPAIRRGPGEGREAQHGQPLSGGLSARAEKN